MLRVCGFSHMRHIGFENQVSLTPPTSWSKLWLTDWTTPARSVTNAGQGSWSKHAYPVSSQLKYFLAVYWSGMWTRSGMPEDAVAKHHGERHWAKSWDSQIRGESAASRLSSGNYWVSILPNHVTSCLNRANLETANKQLCSVGHSYF